MVRHAAAALEQPRERLRSCGERRRMAFEQLEEIALPRQQALEPGEHAANPRLVCNRIDDAARARSLAKAAVAEGADHRLQVGRIEALGGHVEREHAPLALVLHLPYPA